eukprot:2979218-Rhodomonas_salina.1
MHNLRQDGLRIPRMQAGSRAHQSLTEHRTRKQHNNNRKGPQKEGVRPLLVGEERICACVRAFARGWQQCLAFD